MVRELFELYATDRYSMKQIETIFWNKGWYVGNKVRVVDMFTKKQKFLPRRSGCCSRTRRGRSSRPSSPRICESGPTPCYADAART